MSLDVGLNKVLIANKEIKDLVYKGWNKRKAGFSSEGNCSEESSTSSDNCALKISWSSSSSSSVDNNTKQTLPKISGHQHHVVTRLNFDDCVIQQYKTTRQKRAKVKRFVINCINENATLSSEPQHCPDLLNNTNRDLREIHKDYTVKSILRGNICDSGVKVIRGNSSIPRYNVEISKSITNICTTKLQGNISNLEKVNFVSNVHIHRECSTNNIVASKCDYDSDKSGERNLEVGRHSEENSLFVSNSLVKNNFQVLFNTNNLSDCSKMCQSNELSANSSSLVLQSKTMPVDGDSNECSERLEYKTVMGTPPESCVLEANDVTSPVVVLNRSFRHKPSSPVIGLCGNVTRSWNRERKLKFKTERKKLFSSGADTDACTNPSPVQLRDFIAVGDNQKIDKLVNSEVSPVIVPLSPVLNWNHKKTNGKTMESESIPQSPILGCIKNFKTRKRQKKERVSGIVKEKNGNLVLRGLPSCHKEEHLEDSVTKEGVKSSLLIYERLVNVRDLPQKTVFDSFNGKNKMNVNLQEIEHSVCVRTPKDTSLGVINNNRNVGLQHSNNGSHYARKQDMEDHNHFLKVDLDKKESLPNSSPRSLKVLCNKVSHINDITSCQEHQNCLSGVKLLNVGSLTQNIQNTITQKSDVFNISDEAQNIDEAIGSSKVLKISDVINCPDSLNYDVNFDTQNVIDISVEVENNLIQDSSIMVHPSSEVIPPPNVTEKCMKRPIDVAEDEITQQCSLKRETSLSSIFIENISSQELVSEYRLLDKQLTQESYSSRMRNISQLTSPPSEVTSEAGVVNVCSGSSSSSKKAERSPRCFPMNVSDIHSAVKKKKRVKKNGLAARLQQLLIQQRSAARMWQHEVKRVNRSTLRGVQLIVSKVWMEGLFTLLLCNPDLVLVPREQRICGSTYSIEDLESMWIIVLNGEAVAPRCLKPLSTIRIYPPWQALRVVRLNVELILSVTHVEVLSTGVSSKSTSLCVEISPLQEFVCPCLHDELEQESCTVELPRCGLDVLHLLFPNLPLAIDWKPADFKLLSVNGEVAEQKGTVAEAVAVHNRSLVDNVWLLLQIFRVFCYRIDGQTSSCDCVWSVLGEDIAGEMCEVILGLQPAMPVETAEWRQLLDGTALGSWFRFSGLTVIKRVNRHKAQGLWAVVQACENRDTVNQEFLYVLSQARSTLELIYLENPPVDKSASLPRVESLTTVLKKKHLDGCSRHTILSKMLSYYNSCFYLTDASLCCCDPVSDAPLYVIVNTRPSCVVPREVSMRRGSVLCLQDLQLYKGQLYADKYSRVLVIRDTISTCTLTLSVDCIASIGGLQPLIGHLRSSSLVKELVTVTGRVSSVEEDTAFAWPACAKCYNDLLCELQEGLYFCQSCSEHVQVCTKMSLEVFLSCSVLPPRCQVKVKLQQDSIACLLPPQDNGKGYEMASVLGKTVGPLLCVVCKVRPANSGRDLTFILEEIPSWENNFQDQLQEIDKIMNLSSSK